ncbi:MAG: hypothetical protein U0T78_06885 [Cloacibacterium normanense]
MKIKTINSEKYYPITEIIYLFTEKDLKISSFLHKKITLMKKNFINSFKLRTSGERNFKAFFSKSLELSLEIEGYEDMSAKERLLNLYFIFLKTLP